MIQEKSWARIEGVAGHPGLVAQIFFAFDSDRLDSSDQRVLAGLAQGYQLHLLGHRIELTFVGHADQRGNVGYNRELGFRRARAVKMYIDKILGSGRFSLYSSKDALSRGALDAAHGHVTASRMALDRRVDIFSSYVPALRIDMPPLHIEATRPARRLSYREFRKSEGRDMFDLGKPDPIGDNIVNLIKYWGTRGVSIYGNEVKASRRVVTVPVTHRVNTVTISTEAASKVGLMYTAAASNTYVTYEWGPPRGTVSVTWTRKEKDLNSGKVNETSKTQSFPRSEVEHSPVIFPPDPE